MFKIKPLTAEHKYETKYTNTQGNSGIDIYSPVTVTIPAKAVSFKLPLGIAVQYTGNTGYYLYPRSSMGSKTPLRLANSVGIIDSGYRGEITAIVDNVSDQSFTITAGERYFQLCTPDLSPVGYTLVDELSETSRGAGGFGSTGR